MSFQIWIWISNRVSLFFQKSFDSVVGSMVGKRGLNWAFWNVWGDGTRTRYYCWRHAQNVSFMKTIYFNWKSKLLFLIKQTFCSQITFEIFQCTMVCMILKCLLCQIFTTQLFCSTFTCLFSHHEIYYIWRSLIEVKQAVKAWSY